MIRKAVLFDMDGTLVDSEPLHFSALVQAVEAMGYTVPEGFADRTTGMTGAECHALLQQTIGLTETFEGYLDAKYRCYLDAAHTLRRRHGVDAVLALLGETGTPYAIVSNSERIIVDANLKATGLAQPGLITISRDDVQRGKPHPDPYLAAAERLGVSPAQCIVVEDSILGAASGLAAGMTVIGWSEAHRTDFVFPPDTVVADPHDLASSLAPHLYISFSEQTCHVSR
jgi:HAD superfamily hydrolase (TIGR01509 family)